MAADTLLNRQAEALLSRQESALDPLAVDAAGAAKLLGISLAHLFALKAAGKFGPRPIRFGRAVRYRVEELREWLAAGAPTLEKWRIVRGEAR